MAMSTLLIASAFLNLFLYRDDGRNYQELHFKLLSSAQYGCFFLAYGLFLLAHYLFSYENWVMSRQIKTVLFA